MAKVTLFWFIAVAAAVLNLSESRVVKETDVIERDVYHRQTPSVVHEQIEVVETAPVVHEQIEVVEHPRTKHIETTDIYRTPGHVGHHHGGHIHRYATHGRVHPTVYETGPVGVIEETTYVGTPGKTTVVGGTEKAKEIDIKFEKVNDDDD